MLKILGVILSWINPFSLISKVMTYFKVRKFNNVFGKDAGKEYHIIYKINKVKDKSTIYPPREPKFPREHYRGTTNLTSINSCATTRAVGYLVYAFGEKVNKPPIISSTADTDEKMDISFVSIGGTTNLKTCDLLKEVSNFADSIRQQTTELGRANRGADCAYIIKIHPQSNLERTWLCCGGLGEWGSSGAAWYLSRHWKDIYKWAKNRPFAIITKTDGRGDETTLLVQRFLRNSKTGEFKKLTIDNK